MAAREATAEEAQFLLEKARHKEIKQSLAELTRAVNSKNDDGIRQALQQHADAIETLAQAVTKLPVPDNTATALAIESLEKKIDVLIVKTVAMNEQLLIMNLPQESKIEFKRSFGDGPIQSPIIVTSSKTIKAQA